MGNCSASISDSNNQAVCTALVAGPRGNRLVALLEDLILKHMIIQDAVDETNAYLIGLKQDADGNPITEQWQTIGRVRVQS